MKISIFNYSTLKTELDKSTKSLIISIREDVQAEISQEMLFELESLLAWTANHIEINSILFTSQNPLFCSEIDKSIKDKEKLQKLYVKFQKIIYAFFYMPQTIVMDLREGSHGLGAEFALGADIRIASEKVQISFDHLNYGLIPGQIGLIQKIFPVNLVKNWILTGLPLDANALLSTQHLYQTYANEEERELLSTKILGHIAQQSPMARMQAKKAVLDLLLGDFEKTMLLEQNLVSSLLNCNDWREAMEADQGKREPMFMDPLQFKAMLQARQAEQAENNS